MIFTNEALATADDELLTQARARLAERQERGAEFTRRALAGEQELLPELFAQTLRGLASKPDLADEIGMVRLFARRATLSGIDAPDAGEVALILSRLLNTLVRLLTLQRALTTSAEDALAEALLATLEELDREEGA